MTNRKQKNIMEKFALLIRLKAKPGKEKDVADFLKSALPLVLEDPNTVNWYGWQIGDSNFGIFDTFETEAGKTYLKNKVIAALMTHAGELLLKEPRIKFVDILAVK